MQTIKENSQKKTTGCGQQARARAVKVMTYDSIEAFLRNPRTDNNAPGEDQDAWGLVLDGYLLIELPDGSRWGMAVERGEDGYERDFALPYEDIYLDHLERRHTSRYTKSVEWAEMFVRADRTDLTKIFCENCGWLDPVRDPEIAG